MPTKEEVIEILERQEKRIAALEKQLKDLQAKVDDREKDGW